MEQQLIISIGREFGSAGHEIAQKLANFYELPLYDSNLLKEVAAARNLNSEHLEEFDEAKRNKLFYRSVRGMDSSPEHNVAQMQFDFLRQKAQAGESFVVVGRCSETVLKDFPGMISIFVLGDKDKKTARVIRLYQVSEDKAQKMMAEQDKKRKQYHNSHCPGKWGDSRNYDISINSSKLGVDESVRLLTDYINARMQKNRK